MALLGAMIFDNNVIGDVVEIVNSAEMFAFAAHQVVFEAILRPPPGAKPIDLVVLRDDLAKDGGLDSVGRRRLPDVARRGRPQRRQRAPSTRARSRRSSSSATSSRPARRSSTPPRR
jgi:hypothetical protein